MSSWKGEFVAKQVVFHMWMEEGGNVGRQQRGQTQPFV
jgi:hypothetical protein